MISDIEVLSMLAKGSGAARIAAKFKVPAGQVKTITDRHGVTGADLGTLALKVDELRRAQGDAGLPSFVQRARATGDKRLTRRAETLAARVEEMVTELDAWDAVTELRRKHAQAKAIVDGIDAQIKAELARVRRTAAAGGGRGDA